MVPAEQPLHRDPDQTPGGLTMSERTDRPEYVGINLDAEYDLSVACDLPDGEDERDEIVAAFEREYMRQAGIIADTIGVEVTVRIRTDEGLTDHPFRVDEDWPTWEHMIWQAIHDRISIDRHGRVIEIDDQPLMWAEVR